MAEVVLDGVRTNYEIVGEGPPLLMFAPGGFDGTIEKWRTAGVYQRTRMLDHLARQARAAEFSAEE